MAKHWRVIALVALALLVGTEGAPQVHPRSYQPEYSLYPSEPIRQPAALPEYPRYPPEPIRQPAALPEYPRYPSEPIRQPAAPPEYSLYPSEPIRQPAALLEYPRYRPEPIRQPAALPEYPRYPPEPIRQPAAPPVYRQYPPGPVFQPPQPPGHPGYPHAYADNQQQVPQPQLPQPPQPPQPPQKPMVPPQKPMVPKVPQTPQVPAVPKTPTFFKPSVPAQPNAQRCDVAANVRIPCGGSDISAAGCEAIKCCFDGQQCYFGKAVTVHCTKDAQFIVVVAKDATLPNIDLESISLMGQDEGCTHVDSNSEFAIYQFPVTSCGSVVMEETGVIIYENRMSSSYEVGIGPHGVITRDSYYELLFQCRYIGTSVETVVVEVLSLNDSPLPIAALGPIRVHLRLANGQCNTKGCNEVDVAYGSFYTEADYPVSKVLRDPVYVEVQIIGKTDPNLVLTLGRCWTTTSPDPHSLPQWDILTDGCPYRDDRYLSSLVPVGSSSGLDFPGHYRRFLFKMFTFVDPSSMEPMKQQVYIHCSTTVCSAAAGQSCEPSCLRKKRDVKAADQKAEPRVVASVGPVIMGRGQ